MGRSRATLWVPLSLVLVGLSWWWAHRFADRAAAATPPARANDPGADENQANRERAPRAAPTANAQASDPDVPQIDRAKRDQMRALIWQAFGQTPPPTAATPKRAYVLPEHGAMWTGNETPSKDEPGIEPEYIRDSVRGQFFPVARKCYGDALEKTPNLHGEIDLWFVIVGDAKVGGIVESVDVLNKSTLRDPDVIECLRESFLGVTFPPPKGGGYVTVEYPIVFSPEDDDAGSAAH